MKLNFMLIKLALLCGSCQKRKYEEGICERDSDSITSNERSESRLRSIVVLQKLFTRRSTLI